MRSFLFLAIAALLIGCNGSGGGTDSSGGGVAASPPSSGGSGSTVSESDFPVPFYPGSKVDDSVHGGNSAQDVPSGRVANSTRLTPDSIQQVEDFYKDKMTVLESTASGDTGLVTGNVKNGDSVNIRLTHSAQGTQIALGTTHTTSK